MSSADLFADDPAQSRSRRFAVAWRNTTLAQIHAVGALSFDGWVYRFRYLSAAAEVPGFRAFIGFPRLGDTYTSNRLWPFFALRAMDRRRPDFEEYVNRLGLTKDASVLDILGRSGGEMQGDVSVNLVEAPPVHEDGSTECSFLVRGARHATKIYGSAGAVDSLRAGDRLALRPDSSNPVNGQAVLVTTEQEAPVGWVPDVLAPYFHDLARRPAALTVVRNNGSDVAWHVRLLVQAVGTVDPSFDVFADPRRDRAAGATKAASSGEAS